MMTTGLARGGWLRERPARLFAMIFCAQCDRTIYAMTIAWLAIGETADLAAAGRILVWWPVISLFAGPLFGVLVDRSNRRNALILGQVLRVSALAWLLLDGRFDMATMHGATVLACLGAMLAIPSLQALLQAVGGRTRPQLVIGAVLAGLAAEILAAIAAGCLIATLGASAALLACVFLAGAAAALAVPLRQEGARPMTDVPEPFAFAAAAGFRTILRAPGLPSASIAYILAWASAQVTVALLPAFARFELDLGAGAYGAIDAMWGVGGVVGGAALLRRPGATGRKCLMAILLLLATATAGFSAAESLWVALALHGLMGGLFTIAAASAEARIIKLAEPAAIGRIRGNLQAAVGASGIALFLLPSLLDGNSARTLYLLYAAVLAVAVMVLMGGERLLKRRARARTRGRRTSGRRTSGRRASGRPQGRA